MFLFETHMKRKNGFPQLVSLKKDMGGKTGNRLASAGAGKSEPE